MCYYFDDIIKLENLDSDILLEKKPYKNVLIYDISEKALIRAKPLRIRLNKVDRFIRIYDRTRYLVLFGPEKNGTI